MNRHFRMPDGLAVALGMALLLAAGLFAAFVPHPEFSDHERRYLSTAPAAPQQLENLFIEYYGIRHRFL